MPHVQGADRNEVLLFPEALDDYITPENPVRFIDAFVSNLDLTQLGFTHATLGYKTPDQFERELDITKKGPARGLCPAKLDHLMYVNAHDETGPWS